MLQETSTWDLRSLSPPFLPGGGLYLLFLFAACLSATAKLVKLWRAAPPFRLERQEKNPAYLQMLEVTSGSLRQWTICTFLAWGLLASVGLYDFCNRLLGEKRGQALRNPLCHRGILNGTDHGLANGVVPFFTSMAHS